MSRWYEDDRVTVHHGDCLDVLRTLPDCSVDSVVTDPPYGLEFMGKEWDSFRQVDPRTAGRAREVEGASGTSRGEKSYTVAFGGQFRKHSAKAPNCDGEWEQVTLYADQAPPAILAFGEWCRLWAAECLRVLKPGGHMLAFGGTRTWHRLACAVEDAGFEIRDTVASLGGGDSAGLLWMHGQGFPKSLDVSRAIDKAAGAERQVVGTKLGLPGYGARNGIGLNSTMTDDGWHGVGAEHGGLPITAPATEDAARWEGFGTALKPAFEPIVVARRPLAGTVAANVIQHGTGALNIAATRVATVEDTARRPARQAEGSTYSYDGMMLGGNGSPLGRWPANVVLTHGECAEDVCEEGCPVAELDRQSGRLTTGGVVSKSRANAGRVGGFGGDARERESLGYTDEGGASRFFPTFRYQAKAPTRERPKVDGVAHPTCKPLTLMRWMARLVTPPGGVILDPFAGSGTTAEAAILDGFRCITIEREAEYLPLILERIQRQQSDPVEPPEKRPVAEQMSLLDDGEAVA